ncbi:hypothetical protein PR001_g9091 [Phytophthora rubi]|uniref:Uncharacterized protein n=1 Tax=Phytophthora rubi TaxID=129364 RepID=A0A6A3N2W4_9STRA|nr:hypothetical protein PR001_g9091 [Phytophthora rubi]
MKLPGGAVGGLASFQPARNWSWGSHPRARRPPRHRRVSTGGRGIASPPGSLPMSPQQPPPQRSDSGGARLNAFLNQVPAAHHFPLMHVERPSGQQPPPKAKPAPRP